MISFFKKHKYTYVLMYLIIYLIWFFFLEGRTDVKHYDVYCKLDDKIPFLEVFVVPYLIWYVYIIATGLYLLLKSEKDFFQYTGFLFIGMTICLIIYTFWPNAQGLRVESFPRENIFTDLINLFYTHDTSTNVCPSIHVYNSIGTHIAISHCESLKKHKWIQISSFLLMISICLSTMFIKQHSFIDFVCGILLAIVIYVVVYRTDYSKFKK